MVRGGVLLRRIITFLHICLIAWYKIVKRRLVIAIIAVIAMITMMAIMIMVTLLLLTIFSIYFSAVFSAITYYNDLYSYFGDYMSCDTVTAYFYYSGDRSKCFSNTVLTAF